MPPSPNFDESAAPAPDLLLAAIVSSSDDAIISKDLNGVITSWNKGAETMFGYHAKEAIGQSIRMLIPSDLQDEETRILSRLQQGERVEHFETVRLRKNGEAFPISLTISPVHDVQGQIVGASKIGRDITELRRITKEVEQLLESERLARFKAENANRLKDEFLSTVSHELRTPLNAIVGWTQVLKDTLSGNHDALDGLEVIERNAQVQSRLIEDLLDLGRIASGKMALNPEPIEIATVIYDALASVRPAAESKLIVLRSILQESNGSLLGDRKRLQQVFWNLLSNAIKFTPKNGRVTITASRVNSQLEISVTDNGKGIDPTFLPYVFERFRQEDSSITRIHGGLGIGLSLVKLFTELHGGEVRATSPGPNLGSTFTISLPVTAASQTQYLSGDEHESGVAHAAQIDLSNIKVLAVEDDADSLQIVKRILGSRGARVEGASSAAEGLEVLSSFTPDIIVSDIGMPEQDGYSFIRSVRKTSSGAKIPAVALTALARSEDRTRALQAGFQMHVPKPVVPSELIAVVHALASLRTA